MNKLSMFLLFCLMMFSVEVHGYVTPECNEAWQRFLFVQRAAAEKKYLTRYESIIAPYVRNTAEFWHDEARWMVLTFEEKKTRAAMFLKVYQCNYDKAATFINIRGLHNGRLLARFNESKGMKNY